MSSVTVLVSGKGEAAGVALKLTLSRIQAEVMPCTLHPNLWPRRISHIHHLCAYRRFEAPYCRSLNSYQDDSSGFLIINILSYSN